jgi:hypothetical protein
MTPLEIAADEYIRASDEEALDEQGSAVVNKAFFELRKKVLEQREKELDKEM